MDMGIFRKAALEKMASPEQLDRLLSVTGPKGWLAVLAVAGFMVFVLAWSILGTVTMKVNGKGIMLSQYGMTQVMHAAGGLITNIDVSEGDTVVRGQIVARFDQPELVAEVTRLQEHWQNAINQGNTVYAAELEPQLKLARTRLERASWAVSPCDGRVIELKARSNELLPANAPVMIIEQTQQAAPNLHALVYIPHSKQKIAVGMDVNMDIDTVSKETYGLLMGKVTYVSDYPVTVEHIEHVVGNKELAAKLANDNLAIEVRVELTPDPTEKSGYSWTSPVGPPTRLSGGQLCENVNIIVKKVRPIQLLLP